MSIFSYPSHAQVCKADATYYFHSNVFLLTMDMPKILSQRVPTGNRDSGTRVQNLYPSQPYTHIHVSAVCDTPKRQILIKYSPGKAVTDVLYVPSSFYLCWLNIDKIIMKIWTKVLTIPVDPVYKQMLISQWEATVYVQVTIYDILHLKSAVYRTLS